MLFVERRRESVRGGKRADVSSSKMGLFTKLLATLRGLSPTDMVGSAAAAGGIVLVALGIVLQEIGVASGASIRALGGVVLLGGLGAVLFGEPRRRAAVVGTARRIVERYVAATAAWRWPEWRSGWSCLLPPSSCRSSLGPLSGPWS